MARPDGEVSGHQSPGPLGSAQGTDQRHREAEDAGGLSCTGRASGFPLARPVLSSWSRGAD